MASATIFMALALAKAVLYFLDGTDIPKGPEYDKKSLQFIYVYFLLQDLRECNKKTIFFISEIKHMVWVLKRTVSMRQFF